jgi:hypothetical protein
MPRYRECRHCGALHRLDRWPHNCRDAPWPKSDLPAPMIISDALDDVFNHADGKRYSSKRAYERAVREAGCVIVGNELPQDRVRDYEFEPDEADIFDDVCAELRERDVSVSRGELG